MKEIFISFLGKFYKGMVHPGRIPPESEHKWMEQFMPNFDTATLRRKLIR